MRWILYLAGTLGFLFHCHLGSASPTNANLILQEDNVPAYSGPGFSFRPLLLLKKGTKLSVNPQIVQTKEGDFYRVLLVFKSGRKRIGYISVARKTTLENTSQAEELESYLDLELADTALQINMNYMRSDRLYWTLGYMKYPAPSFYLKAMAGQYFSQTSASPLVGGEIGTDHFITNVISLYTSFGLGIVAAPQDNELYEGSTALNLFSHAGTGIRYNANLAAVVLGIGQNAVFNGNNSELAWAINLGLEVGL